MAAVENSLIPKHESNDTQGQGTVATEHLGQRPQQLAAGADIKCLFCRIANNLEPNSRVLHATGGVALFEDIRPAAAHHYLVVPQTHIRDPRQLRGEEDKELVEMLVAVGLEYLTQAGGDVNDVRLGFHWPPFNSVTHLHLHVISPASRLGFLASLVFRPGTPWFVTTAWLLKRLKSMKDSS